MNHIDLFSGIGGFALAAREVWGEEYNNLFFCDNNEFCQEVIKKNFGKESLIYGDIREVTKERFIADTECNGCAERYENGKSEIGKSQERWMLKSTGEGVFCDILTGGFPCQPFSCAGKRKGTNDDRHLWPEMLRVIQDFKPTWIIAENVRGILTIESGLVFEQVCLDLERESYEVQPFVIPACAVNAPHRRDRVWIVANRKNEWQERSKSSGDRQGQPETEAGNRDSNAPDTIDIKGRTKQEKQSCGQTWTTIGEYRSFSRGEWSQSWLEVATRLCGMDDGLPGRMGNTTISKSKHRVEQLKAYGNAIVPQVAVEIMRAIKAVKEIK